MTAWLLILGTHRSELDLRYAFVDKGVTGLHRTHYVVSEALGVSKDGITLRVTGKDIDHTWTGAYEGESLILRRGGLSQTFRCVQEKNILRCDPATLRKGFAWSDPLPAYMRAPITVAIHGTVKAFIDVTVPAGDEKPGPPTPVRLVFPTSDPR